MAGDKHIKSETKKNLTNPHKWDKTADVVIVGSGAAGLTAAIEAANHKSTVVILEKMPFFGGNSILSGGNYTSYGTDLQKQRGINDPNFRDDSADLYYLEKRALGDFRSNPVLTRTFVEDSLEGYFWLTGLGVKYNEVMFNEKTVLQPEGARSLYLAKTYNTLFENGVWSGLQTKGRHHRKCKYKNFKNGVALMRFLRDAAQQRGIDLLTKIHVLEALRENGLTGDVLGVRFKNQNIGKIQTIKAKKAVIIAAGGFSANIAMCVKHDQRINPKVRSTGGKGVKGDLLIASQDIGADTVNMDFIQIRMDRSAVAYRYKVLTEKPGTYIDVDFHGNRFWKEMSDIASYRNARLTLVHSKNILKWYGISDSEGIITNNKSEKEIEKHLKLKTAYRANTIEELAQIINVPIKILIETIDCYNEFVAKGIDEDFGQHSTYLKWKIEVPPFFAMPKTYYIQHTLGGVCINDKAQVTGRNGKIIPRLYAAGEFVGGAHGLDREGGSGITECIVFGRIAGKYAALEKNC